VYQPKTEFKERRTPTSQHSAKKKIVHPHHISRKASCYFVQKKGQKELEKRGEKKRKDR